MALGDIEHVPVKYGVDPPDMSNREVYILDFSYPRQQMIEMHSKAKSLVCIDHHITAKQDLEGLDFCLFDMNESGASLTWKYFVSNGLLGSDMPPLVSYVRDRDLWLWQLKDSKLVSARIMATPYLLEEWDKLAKMSVEELIEAGKNCRLVVDNFVSERAKDAYEILLDNQGFIVVCSPQQHISDVLDNLITKHNKPAIGWGVDKLGFRVSFRSRDNLVDVSKVAKEFGGGGHRNAAGCTLNYKDGVNLLFPT
jgi:oligoribonuclease NrnB/cAMP/cGMP phosphodiesterase (DHH superfamily)